MNADIDAVLFNVDGTLVDSYDAIIATYTDALREVSGNYSLDPWGRLDVEYILQMPASEVFQLLAEGRVDRTAELSAVFQRLYAEREPNIAWFDGAVDVLHELYNRELAFGIVTTESRTRLNQHLASAGVTGLFAATISGDETTHPKPNPAPVLAVLDRLNISAERALLVGDAANDIVAARHARVLSVGVAYGFHPAQCHEANPDHWINTIRELLNVIPTMR